MRGTNRLNWFGAGVILLSLVLLVSQIEGGIEMKQKATEMKPMFWVALFGILGTQATLLFLDARKRGYNKWLWGGLGLIQFPMPTIAYMVYHAVTKKKG